MIRKLVFPLAVALTLSMSISCASKGKKAAEGDKAAKTAEAQVDKAAKKADAKKDAAKTNAASMACTSGSDARTIAVNSKDSGCEVAYTKMGNEEVVASGMNGMDHCNRVQERIVKNLESAGFSCK